MARPWTWVPTEGGQVHATATDTLTAGVEISAVCGAMVTPVPTLVEVGCVDPCLSCVQLIGAIDWAVEQLAGSP